MKLKDIWHDMTVWKDLDTHPETGARSKVRTLEFSVRELAGWS
jgi:hypothetical protein